MIGSMTVPTIAAVVLAMLAAVLGVIAFRQRRKLSYLEAEAVGARPAQLAGEAMHAMISALREPALLHGERIVAANEALAAIAGIPVAELAGKALSEVVAREYAELAALAVTRALAGEASPT